MTLYNEWQTVLFVVCVSIVFLTFKGFPYLTLKLRTGDQARVVVYVQGKISYDEEPKWQPIHHKVHIPGKLVGYTNFMPWNVIGFICCFQWTYLHIY